MLLLLSTALAASPEATEEPVMEELVPGEIVVEAERPPPSPVSGSLEGKEIEAFPARSPEELLRAIPGVHLSAHGGRGKAYQFFVRGFDAVHGADLAVSVEGVPLNEPSNTHGHGYLDLHLVPRSLVEGVSWTLGSPRPDRGDFAVAASADYALGLRDPGLSLALGAGTDRSGLVQAAFRPDKAPASTFLVAEAEGGEGMGEHRGYQQLRAAAGLGFEGSSARGRVFVLGYDGEFESPGVIRADDLEAGRIGFWDSHRSFDGGHSRRALGGAKLGLVLGRAAVDATAWAGMRELSLQHDFTGWIDDPVHGGGVLQDYRSLGTGGRLELRRTARLFGRSSALFAGSDLRLEQGTSRDARVDAALREHALTLDTDFLHQDLGGWAGLQLGLPGELDLLPALRVDRLRLETTHRVDPSGEIDQTPETALGEATVLSPKAGLRWSPSDQSTLFAWWGRGFRSPEARGVTLSGPVPVMQATSAEIGARTRLLRALSLQASIFRIEVEDELLLDHASGRFLSGGATRRDGVELSAILQGEDRPLGLELDLTATDGRYIESGQPLPAAPRWLGSARLFLVEKPLGKGGRLGELTGGLRAWVLGPRALPFGFVAEPSWVADLVAGWERERWTAGIQVDNLLGQPWIDGEFMYPSWFDRSTERSELPARHITAGTPPALRAQIGVRL